MLIEIPKSKGKTFPIPDLVPVTIPILIPILIQVPIPVLIIKPIPIIIPIPELIQNQYKYKNQ
jgi:hypothetical protein